jgi:hypothetical protein
MVMVWKLMLTFDCAELELDTGAEVTADADVLAGADVTAGALNAD